MKTAGELCYESWCQNAGVTPKTPYERAKDNAMGPLFTDLMNSHMIQGYFRYGSVRTYRDNPIYFLGKIIESMGAFDKDGNIEHFVDIANWARIAFHYTDHPNKHYTVAKKRRE
jgi:hypothetical protein